MKGITPFLYSMGAAFLLTGCGSPKEASKDNFKKVINEYLEKNCILVSPRNSGFPVTLELLPVENKLAAEQNPKKTLQYDALVGIGMLDVYDGSVEGTQGLYSKNIITLPTKTYSLSKKGEKNFTRNVSKSPFTRPQRGFCIAKYQVNEVLNYSEPSGAMGYTISNVNYSQFPTKIKGWASDQAIRKAFPGLARQLESNQHATATLVLMNDGWKHEKEITR